ncbi:MAG: hypothetical protein MUE53_06010 [Chitinophagales bacterium]|jgi:hypothetical protein|nr:hypothetical protein [Chitinophagales bacterium]
MLNQYIGVFDYILLFLLWIFGGYIIFLISSNIAKDKVDKRVLNLGFHIKVIGAVISVLIYNFYYSSGDTTYYFVDAKELVHLMFDDFTGYLKVIFTLNTTNFYLEEPQIFNRFIYIRDTKSFNVPKIGSIFSLITFNSIYGVNFLCAVFSYIAHWKFYKMISMRYPQIKGKIGLTIFAIPSVFFWSSALFKDNFCYSAILFIIVYAHKFFVLRKIRISYIIIILISIFIIILIRSFNLMVLIPTLFFYITLSRFENFNNLLVKTLIIPLVLFGIMSILILFYSKVLTDSELGYGNLESKLQGFQNWHTTLKGSAYNLKGMDNTSLGYLKVIPSALIVTYFRPWPFELQNSLMFLSSLQGLFFLFFTLYWVGYKMKFVYFIKAIYFNNLAFFCFAFSMFYAYIAGITSYNFGALDRYRVPALSMYILSILIAYQEFLSSSSNTNDAY